MNELTTIIMHLLIAQSTAKNSFINLLIKRKAPTNSHVTLKMEVAPLSDICNLVDSVVSFLRQYNGVEQDYGIQDSENVNECKPSLYKTEIFCEFSHTCLEG